MAKRSFWEDLQINDDLVIETIKRDGKDTIYFKDKNSRFIWNNKTHAMQFGIEDPNELVGKTDRDFFRDGVDPYFFIVEKESANGWPIVFEMNFNANNGYFLILKLII